MAAGEVKKELFRFAVADGAQGLRDLLRLEAKLDSRPLAELRKERDKLRFVGRGKRKAKLKTSPHGAVQKLAVIGRGHGDYIARQLVDLHQQRRDDPLNLAGLVRIAALFADGVEFVEEQYAGRCPCIIENAL